MWLNDEPRHEVRCPYGRSMRESFMGSYSLAIPWSMQVQGYVQKADFYRCSCFGSKGLLCVGDSGVGDVLCRFERQLDAIDYEAMIREREFDGRLMFLKQIRMIEVLGSIEDGFVLADGVMKADTPHLLTSPLLQPHERGVFEIAFRMSVSGFEGPAEQRDTSVVLGRLRDNLPKEANRQGMITRWNGDSFDLEATESRFAVSNAVAQG
jgi:hypothetical protein